MKNVRPWSGGSGARNRLRRRRYDAGSCWLVRTRDATNMEVPERVRVQIDQVVNWLLGAHRRQRSQAEASLLGDLCERRLYGAYRPGN